jgi:hypothetical protein
MTQTLPPAAPADAPVEIHALRIRLGAEQPAAQPDPLGRAFTGYAEGLTQSELWDRGRGVWRARLASVAEAQLAVIVAPVSEVVVAVGTVDGVRFHGDRVALEGRVLPDHPLVGQPDPLANTSRNPVTFGLVRTAPPWDVQRPAADVLADAVRVMTEAVKLRRPTMRPTGDGRWETDPDRTEPADWAEFVTLALAGATANAGGIDIALAGRPGSWEADGVRQLLYSTVGHDEEHLWEHRTEPLSITLYVEELLAEVCDIHAQYDAAVTELERRREQAIADAGLAYDVEDYAWTYRTDDAGEWTAQDPAAPAWSWEGWRASTIAGGASPEQVDEQERYLRAAGQRILFPLLIAKSPEANAEMDRRQQGIDIITDSYDELQGRLEDQRQREWADYGTALQTHIEAAAAAIEGLTVPVEVRVDIEAYRAAQASNDEWGLEARLVDQARAATWTPDRLPGTPLDRLDQS